MYRSIQLVFVKFVGLNDFANHPKEKTIHLQVSITTEDIYSDSKKEINSISPNEAGIKPAFIGGTKPALTQ